MIMLKKFIRPILIGMLFAMVLIAPLNIGNANASASPDDGFIAQAKNWLWGGKQRETRPDTNVENPLENPQLENERLKAEVVSTKKQLNEKLEGLKSYVNITRSSSIFQRVLATILAGNAANTSHLNLNENSLQLKTRADVLTGCTLVVQAWAMSNLVDTVCLNRLWRTPPKYSDGFKGDAFSLILTIASSSCCIAALSAGGETSYDLLISACSVMAVSLAPPLYKYIEKCFE